MYFSALLADEQKIVTCSADDDKSNATRIVLWPDEHGETTRTVRSTVDRKVGDASSNTEKGMLNVVPTGAEAVDKPQGASPTAANM